MGKREELTLGEQINRDVRKELETLNPANWKGKPINQDAKWVDRHD